MSIYETIFESDSVMLKRFCDRIQAYKKVTYRPALWKVEKTDFLSTNCWELSDGTYHEIDGIGFRTGRTADSIDQIASMV